LVAFTDPERAASTFWGEAVRKLKVGEGLAGYVLSSEDLEADVLQIRGRGLEIADPQEGSRTRPDGELVLWKTAIAGGTPAGILPFLIQDITPRELRSQPPQEGLGTHLSVKEVIVATRNVEVARQSYRELVGIEPRYVQNTARDLSGYRVNTSWGSIILAHPERKANAMSDQLAQRGEGLYAINLVADDVNRARTEVTRQGFQVEDDPTGFLILPQSIGGVRLRIVQT
jgi:hypothetical protein